MSWSFNSLRSCFYNNTCCDMLAGDKYLSLAQGDHRLIRMSESARGHMHKVTITGCSALTSTMDNFPPGSTAALNLQVCQVIIWAGRVIGSIACTRCITADVGWTQCQRCTTLALRPADVFCGLHCRLASSRGHGCVDGAHWTSPSCRVIDQERLRMQP